MGSENPPWFGKRVGVTAGPTRAWIDPVRYLANASTGELGALIAEGLAERGASVDFVHGPGSLVPSRQNIRPHPVETVSDLEIALESLASEQTLFDVWIHAMAVLDYIPSEASPGKISSNQEEWVLRLKPTPKVISHFKILFPSALLVGFKLETTADVDELRREAETLSRRHGCDLVVANACPFHTPGVHTAHLLDPEAEDSWTGPFDGKIEIARALIDRLESKALRHVSR